MRAAASSPRRDDWIVTPNLFGGIVGDLVLQEVARLGTVTRFLDRLEAKEAEKLEDAKRFLQPKPQPGGAPVRCQREHEESSPAAKLTN